MQKTSIALNNTREGETIEQYVRRLQHNGEAIEANTSINRVYTERSEGVKPETNIRTDAWNQAIEGIETKVAGHLEAREKRKAKPEQKTDETTS